MFFRLSLLFLIVFIQESYSNNPLWDSIFQSHSAYGTFVLYDFQTNEYTYHNQNRADSAFIPASTFKIVNSLIALENNTVTSVNDTISWDGKDYGWDAWNRTHSLATAFQYSCVWYYQAIARKTGKKTMQYWLDSIGYGNGNLSSPIDQFWLSGQFAISAQDQVDFLNKLVRGTLPFKPSVQEDVKKIMVVHSDEHYTMYAKTGWAMQQTPQIGWYVGFIEQKGKFYTFVMNMHIHKREDAQKRKEITNSILRLENIIN